MIKQYISWRYWRPLMEKESCVNSVIIALCFWFSYYLEFFMGKCNFLVFSDHGTLIFNIILTFYFSLFKTLSFSCKSHLIKTLFAIFNKFTILFTFEIEQLKYMKTLNTWWEYISYKIMFISKGLKYLNISKKNLSSNGFLLLQETYSSLADEKKWADELKGPIFFFIW